MLHDRVNDCHLNNSELFLFGIAFLVTEIDDKDISFL